MPSDYASIVIGVCGIGHGHCSREFEMATRLKEAGHRVVILGFGTSTGFFRSKGFEVFDVWVPIIRGGKNGIKFSSVLRDNFKTCWYGTVKNLSVLMAMKKIGVDLFISDYEPVSAFFARIHRKPSVTVDQQSKYRYFDFPVLDGLSQKEERQRLSFFFPHVDKSFTGIIAWHP